MVPSVVLSSATSVPSVPSLDPSGYGFWMNGVPKIYIGEWGYIGTEVGNFRGLLCVGKGVRLGRYEGWRLQDGSPVERLSKMQARQMMVEMTATYG